MKTVLDMFLGFGLYIFVGAAGFGYSYVLLPYNETGRMFSAIFGGGTLLLFVTVIILGNIHGPRS